MHALLFVGTDKEKIKEEIKNEGKRSNSRVVHFASQKISDIKQIAQFTKLSRKKSVLIVCEDINTASIEALNSFLKILEEPAKNVSFALTAENMHDVLPTIVSRCKVVKTRSKGISKRTGEKIKKFLESTPQSRVVMLEKIKTREQAMSLVRSTMTYVHGNIDKNPTENRKILEECQLALNRLKTNANVKLQIINFGIKLP